MGIEDAMGSGVIVTKDDDFVTGGEWALELREMFIKDGALRSDVLADVADDGG